MTSVLALALLCANPTDAGSAFERLKKLEGNWRSKDGQTLSMRVIQTGAVIEQLTIAGRLVSVTIYRVEGAELVATLEAEAHQVLKLSQVTASALQFEPGLSLMTRDADSLRRDLKGRVTEFTREYVDTLK